MTDRVTPRPSQPTGRPGVAAHGPAFVAVYKLLLRSVATPGRLVAVLALAGVSVLTAIAVNLNDPFDSLRSATGYVNGNVSTLIPVAVLVFGAATLGDLIDDATLVYLWLRPVPVRLHVLAAWAATVTITVPLVGAPVLLAAAMIDADPALMGATVLTTLLAIATYSAIFVLGGIRFRRALPWGLAYILIWEGFVARAGETAARLSVRSYMRSILAQITGERVELGDFTLASGILVPLVVTVIALTYASRRLARTDVA